MSRSAFSNEVKAFVGKVRQKGGERGTQSLIALMVVAAGFGLLYTNPALKTEAVALMTFVLGYYFGSSPGSRAKDDTLTQIAKGGSNAANQEQ